MERGSKVSSHVFAKDVETMAEFRAWANGQIPNCIIDQSTGEIIIRTGLTVEMNGEIIPLDLEELGEIRA